jgi:hypothetical protein
MFASTWGKDRRRFEAMEKICKMTMVSLNDSVLITNLIIIACRSLLGCIYFVCVLQNTAYIAVAFILLIYVMRTGFLVLPVSCFFCSDKKDKKKMQHPRALRQATVFINYQQRWQGSCRCIEHLR